MNAAINSANWNCPPPAPGAACAQASVIKPFMCVVQEAKRAALCHSTGAAPGSEELRGPGGQPACGDRRPQRAHEAHVEVQVMDRVEARAEDLVAAVEMPQVGAAEVATGVAVAGGIQRAEIVAVSTVTDVDDAGGGEQVAVTGMPCRHDAVEHVDAAQH